jgi:hypothetical protein
MSAYGTSTVKRQRRSREEIERLDAALVEIVDDVAPATVRQVFYQAVVRGLVPKDEKRGYRVVQRRLLALRENGTIPYRMITDNARTVRGYDRYGSAQEYARKVASSYRRDYWANAPERVEVWVEKDALSGVLHPVVVEEFGLELYVTRGFSSVTYLQIAAEEIKEIGRHTNVYVLTDFDPSGLSIAATVERELKRRAVLHGACLVDVERLAVTREQIDRYRLPTRPTKTTDARARTFAEEHGTDSVELDAIEPDTLRQLVYERIERHMDPWRLEQLKMVEQEEREALARMYG